jgi:hypothetical protein
MDSWKNLNLSEIIAELLARIRETENFEFCTNKQTSHFEDHLSALALNYQGHVVPLILPPEFQGSLWRSLQPCYTKAACGRSSGILIMCSRWHK